MQGLSLVAASGGHSSSLCAGLSLSRPLLLWSTGSRRAGSAVLAHGPSCSVACGILPDQGSNPCPLHWQADSQPLSHQGSPVFSFLFFKGAQWVHSKMYMLKNIQGLPLLYQISKVIIGTSLVAQRLRVRLLMQGTRVRALVWEDPTCRGATRPVSHGC